MIDPNAPTTTANFLLTPAPNVFAGHPNWSKDLGVIGTSPTDCGGGQCYLHPVYSLLTGLTGAWAHYAPGADHNGTAIGQTGLFVSWYLNGSRSALAPFGFTTDIQMAPAFDEGGNFIDVRFGPLTIDPTSGFPFANYSILVGTPAGNTGFNFSNAYTLAGNPNPWNLWLTTDYFGNARPHVGAGNVPDIGAVEIQ